MRNNHKNTSKNQISQSSMLVLFGVVLLHVLVVVVLIVMPKVILKKTPTKQSISVTFVQAKDDKQPLSKQPIIEKTKIKTETKKTIPKVSENKKDITDKKTIPTKVTPSQPTQLAKRKNTQPAKPEDNQTESKATNKKTRKAADEVIQEALKFKATKTKKPEPSRKNDDNQPKSNKETDKPTTQKETETHEEAKSKVQPDNIKKQETESSPEPFEHLLNNNTYIPNFNTQIPKTEIPGTETDKLSKDEENDVLDEFNQEDLTTDDTNSGNTSNNTLIPIFVEKVEPIYPKPEKRQQREGIVIFEFTIDEEGKVIADSINVINATTPNFEEAAKKALLESSFEPKYINGIAQQQNARYPYYFKLISF